MDIETFDAGTPVVTALSSAFDNMLITDGADTARFVSAVCQVESQELREILAQLINYWVMQKSDQHSEIDYLCEALIESGEVQL